jgi:hypothetical protein
VPPDPCYRVQQWRANSSWAHVYCAFRLRGLGTTAQMLKNVCRDDIDATTLIDQAVQKPGGRPSKTVSNIHSLDRSSGTTRDRSLRRLRDHRPDLHGRVIADELSPPRAMIEAVLAPHAHRSLRCRRWRGLSGISATNCPPLLPQLGDVEEWLTETPDGGTKGHRTAARKPQRPLIQPRPPRPESSSRGCRAPKTTRSLSTDIPSG